MLRKTLLALLLTFLAYLPAQAFMSKSECQEAAEQLFMAQTVLNQNPVLFAQISAKIKAEPAEPWTEEMKEFVVGVAEKLKQGDDPQAVGQVVFQGCMAKAKAI